MGINKSRCRKPQLGSISIHQFHKHLHILVLAFIGYIKATEILAFSFLFDQTSQIRSNGRCRIIRTLQHHRIEQILQCYHILRPDIDSGPLDALILAIDHHFQPINWQVISLDYHVCSVECQHFTQTCHIMLFFVLVPFYCGIWLHIEDYPFFCSHQHHSLFLKQLLNALLKATESCKLSPDRNRLRQCHMTRLFIFILILTHGSIIIRIIDLLHFWGYGLNFGKQFWILFQWLQMKICLMVQRSVIAMVFAFLVKQLHCCWLGFYTECTWFCHPLWDHWIY